MFDGIISENNVKISGSQGSDIVMFNLATSVNSFSAGLMFDCKNYEN